MDGPYPPNRGVDAVGPPGPHPPPPVGAYPRALPPPVPYPRQSGRRLAAVMATVVAAAAILAAVIGYAVGTARSGNPDGAGTVTGAPAKAAIQGYLNALTDRDIDTIARNALCGIYTRVTDRRSDDAVAKMSSDAFRGQFSRVEVTSVDKVVHLSTAQAQALFTMRVTPAPGNQPRRDIQGVAQLLSVDHQILVCSFVLRSAGTY
jgi:hypothetical protein